MFEPIFTITPTIANNLMRIEAIRQEIIGLPITPKVLASLRETMRIYTTHYSTFIEGNRLTEEQVAEVLQGKHFAGRERDEKEVLGYYMALSFVEELVKKKSLVTEQIIKLIHALVMAGGKTKVKPSPYRDGQNVIREGGSRKIVYLPPEASDVPMLMKELLAWLHTTDKEQLPCPLRAAVAHYQFATIHPYYDGNGRTARLLTTLVLHLGGYDLKGLYSLEEYYASNLGGYYEALAIGPSHNYYLGRAEADITPWVEYFCAGMVESFEKVQLHARKAHKSGEIDASKLLQEMSPQQRKIMVLFRNRQTITAQDIQKFFNLKPRTARALCQKLVEDDFLTIADPSRKGRTYALSQAIRKLL